MVEKYCELHRCVKVMTHPFLMRKYCIVSLSLGIRSSVTRMQYELHVGILLGSDCFDVNLVTNLDMQRWARYGIFKINVTIERQSHCRPTRGRGNGCIREMDSLMVHVGVDNGVTWYVTFHVQVPDVSSYYVVVISIDFGVDEFVFVGESCICSLHRDMKI